MKAKRLVVAMILLAGLVSVSPHWPIESASASTNCNFTVDDTCDGWAQVSTITGGVSGSRCFSLRIVPTAPGCPTTTAPQGAWEMNAGACATLYYFDQSSGASPPPVPNKVTITQYIDDGNTIVRTHVAAGAEPANGASFDFCATDTGLAGGSPRAGTYRIYVRAVKDNGVGGVGNYDVDTDGTGTHDTQHDRGALRARLLVSALSTTGTAPFVYGASGDATIGASATSDAPNGAAGTNTALGILDSATLVAGKLGTPATHVASKTDSFVIDNAFTDQTNAPILRVSGVAALTGASWTIFAVSGHGSNIVRDSTTQVHKSTTTNIDARIRLDSDGAGTFATADGLVEKRLGSSSGPIVSVFNRGEDLYVAGYIFNAADEKLSRSMTFSILDAASTVCTAIGSLTPSANKYSTTTTVPTGGSCTVAATDTGSPRYAAVSNTNQAYTGLQSFAVSMLYYVDAHTQASDPLVEDDFPTENNAEQTSFYIANEGTDTNHAFCHVVGVRKDGTDIDTSGNAVTGTMKDPSAVTRDTFTGDTNSAGWTTHTDRLASTPLGEWTWKCDAAFNGNTGTDTQSFTTQVPEGGGGGDTFQGDPLKVFQSHETAGQGDTLLIAISESYLDGTARTGNAGGTMVYVYDPDGDLLVDAVNPEEVAFGTYTYELALNETAELGNYLVVIRTTDPATMDPVGTSNTFHVAAGISGNITDLITELIEHRNGTLELNAMAFDGLEFDGYMLILVWLAALVWCLRRGKLFAAVACTIGAICTLIPGPEWIQWTGILLFIIVVWLEAMVMGKIYARWFTGDVDEGQRRMDP